MTQSITFSMVRRFARAFCPFVILLIMALPVAHAGEWTGNISGYVGQKTLDDTDWPKLDHQGALGVLFDIRQKDWPVSIAVDIIGSGEKHEEGSRKLVGCTAEYDIGVRKIFELQNSSIRPYIGAGIAFITADLEDKDGATKISQDDNAVGAWLGAGMYVELTSHFILGLDVRYSHAEVTLLDKDREAGGLNTGMTIGYHW